MNEQNKIYVGNLSYSTTNDDLTKLYSEFGEITDVKIIMDMETGRSKGFGFVSFRDESSAAKAVEATNGKDLDGRDIRVNLAENKKPDGKRPFRPHNGGGNGGNNRGYGGYNSR